MKNNTKIMLENEFLMESFVDKIDKGLVLLIGVSLAGALLISFSMWMITA